MLTSFFFASITKFSTTPTKPSICLDCYSHRMYPCKDNIKQGQLVLYPNPLSGKLLNYQFHADAAGIAWINVYNTNGQLVYESQKEIIDGDNQGQIMLPDLPGGYYTLRIETSQTIFHQSFIIK